MEEKKTHKSVEDFSVNTIEIGGIGPALKALHLPFGGQEKSLYSREAETFSPASEDSTACYDCIRQTTTVCVNTKDSKLISTLIKRGDEHAKVLRGVVVWCEINAPRYWWQEMSTYRVGAEGLGSNSTMHQEGRGMDEDELVDMKEHLEEGHMQKRVWMFSYQTLRRIYFQRRNHRLPQWRIFCGWIEKLPFAPEFITVTNDNYNTDK